MEADLDKLQGETATDACAPVQDGDEVRQLAAVMEIAKLVNCRLDLDSILSAISRELTKVIDYDIGCVAIFEKQENCLFIRHIYRKSGDKTGEGRFVPLEEGNLVGWVALNRTPILRGDIPHDERFREIMREDDLKSDIVVPLIAKDQLIGTVNIGSYRLNHFTDFDLDLVTRFSQLTAIAIENSLLIRDIEQLGEKYRLLMRNAHDIILMLNPEGQIVECNQALLDISQYTPAEILGTGFYQLVAPDRRDEAKKTFCSILRGELSRVSDLPYLKKSGEIVYMEISACVIRLNDHPYILAIGHDITERRILQEKIVIQNRELRGINRKLQELDDLKSEFLSRISHELRTPLSIIMAYTGTLIEGGGQSIDDATRFEFLKVIEIQSNKLLNLINDLLDLSKVEISQTMLTIGDGSVNEVVQIAARIVEPYACQSKVEIKVDVDPSIPIVCFDPLRIRQVCVNLLNNAVKFSPEGSVVWISTKDAAREVVVSVQDTGTGIDEKDLPALFERFNQIDGGITRARDGMGIGLRLVKHYIELHGGKVWVKSQRGKGSTFFFSLPKVPYKQELHPLPQLAPTR